MEITDTERTKFSLSNEWVYHFRGGKEPELIRRWQKSCWDMLFKKRDNKALIHELNNKFMPSNIKLVVFDLNDPIEAYNQLKELMAYTEFDIQLLSKK